MGGGNCNIIVKGNQAAVLLFFFIKSSLYLKYTVKYKKCQQISGKLRKNVRKIRQNSVKNTIWENF